MGLLVSTILTSAADSLNPFGITQQFVLQGMVKKPGHIWYFIVAMGMTNLASGYLAYFGLLGALGEVFGHLVALLGNTLTVLQLITGIAFLIGVCYLVLNRRIAELHKELQQVKYGNADGNDEVDIAGKIKSVSPVSLVLLGIGATISELTTALPYFAFLAILFQHQLNFWQITGLLVVYNCIYSSPLILMYILYRKAQDQFDRLYLLIKTQITKWANVTAPAVAGIIGIFLVFHSIVLLQK